jgi:hypothetical protein
MRDHLYRITLATLFCLAGCCTSTPTSPQPSPERVAIAANAQRAVLDALQRQFDEGEPRTWNNILSYAEASRFLAEIEAMSADPVMQERAWVAHRKRMSDWYEVLQRSAIRPASLPFRAYMLESELHLQNPTSTAVTKSSE